MKRQPDMAEDSIAGWISTSDIFLVSSVLILACAAYLAGLHKQLSGDIVETEKANTAVTVKLAETESSVKGLDAKLAAAMQERDRRVEELTREKEAREKEAKLALELGAGIENAVRRETELKLKLRDAETMLSEMAQKNAAARTAAEEAARKYADEHQRYNSAITTVLELREQCNEMQRSMKKMAEHQKVVDEQSKVLRPLDSARLVIKASCANLPKGVEINLVVYSPFDKKKPNSWINPRIWSWDAPEAAEVGMLLPGSAIDSKEGPPSEYCYFTETLQGPENPYFVYVILRRLRDGPETFKAVTVTGEIELKDPRKSTTVASISKQYAIDSSVEVRATRDFMLRSKRAWLFAAFEVGKDTLNELPPDAASAEKTTASNAVIDDSKPVRGIFDK